MFSIPIFVCPHPGQNPAEQSWLVMELMPNPQKSSHDEAKLSEFRGQKSEIKARADKRCEAELTGNKAGFRLGWR